MDVTETGEVVVLGSDGECGLYCHRDLGLNPLSATALL